MQSILESLYHSPRPRQVRTKPMEVIALGLSRSGTDSLREALLQLGYDHTYHGFDFATTPGDTEIWHRLGLKKWHGPPDGEANISAEDFDEVIGHCVAVTDMPAVAFAAELIHAYPDAKVILNSRRDLDAWFTSHLTAFATLHGVWNIWLKSWFCAETYWLWKCFELPFYRFYFDSFEQTAKWRYREHCAMVRGMVPPGRLLEWSVQDGWVPLCAFLKKKAPKEEFPSGNAPKEFLERTGKIRRDLNRKTYTNLTVFAGLLIGVVAAIVQVVR